MTWTSIDMKQTVDFLEARLNEHGQRVRIGQIIEPSDTDAEHILKLIGVQRRAIKSYKRALGHYEDAIKEEKEAGSNPTSYLVDETNRTWSFLKPWEAMMREYAAVYSDHPDYPEGVVHDDDEDPS